MNRLKLSKLSEFLISSGSEFQTVGEEWCLYYLQQPKFGEPLSEFQRQEHKRTAAHRWMADSWSSLFGDWAYYLCSSGHKQLSIIKTTRSPATTEKQRVS